MTCSQAELPRVLKEAEIMIGLEHDNIVRALHCMVVDKQPAATAMQSSAVSADRKVGGGLRAAQCCAALRCWNLSCCSPATFCTVN
jgi:hypothetical protein